MSFLEMCELYGNKTLNRAKQSSPSPRTARERNGSEDAKERRTGEGSDIINRYELDDPQLNKSFEGK
jgi:hypothetical protein